MYNPNPGGWFTPTGGPYTPTPRQEPTELSPAGSASPTPRNPDGSINVNEIIRRLMKKYGFDDDEALAYQADMEAKQEAFKAASGFANKQLDWQIADAKRTRAQAWKQAELIAKTSRYGVDTQARSAAAGLAETARQFDANHGLERQRFGLEQQRFGLDVARTATDYLSTPDRYAQGVDFLSMAQRIPQGLGPTPYMSEVKPQEKTWNDFAVLAGWGNTPQVAAGASGGAASPAVQGGGATGAGPDGIAGTADDPRVKLLGNLVKAVPPSSTPGLAGNDFAVLDAARSIMSTNLPPGALAKTRPDQQAILGSVIRRSGASERDWRAQQVRQGVGQGSTRAA